MSIQEKLDSILNAGIEKGAAPGVAATLFSADTTLYQGGFGERVKGADQTMTPDTIVWLASLTKAITAACALQQVEQGKLSIDDPISGVLPDLADKEILEGFDDQGHPELRAAQIPITLRHLLTHTSGFGYDIWNADLVRYQELMGIPGITGCENKALKTPLLFEPGSRWTYGIGIDWVGKAVEAVTGQKLGAYMKANIFDPIGMPNIGFKLTEKQRENMAKIHMLDEDGVLGATDIEIPQEPEFEMGGGGLYGTILDYAKFLQMVLNKGMAGGQRILSEASIALMTTNQMGSIKIEKLPTALPPFSCDVEFFPGLEKSWSLSFMINEKQAPTGRPAGGLGWAGLANSFYWLDLQQGIGGVYAAQILPFVDPKPFDLFLDFEKAAYTALN